MVSPTSQKEYKSPLEKIWKSIMAIDKKLAVLRLLMLVSKQNKNIQYYNNETDAYGSFQMTYNVKN